MKASGFLVFLTFVAVPLLAQPQRTFVSARNGDDANPCSLAAPCRNLQRGVDAVAWNGEVIPLDSGGYGTVVIRKPVTISTPSGIQASVTTTSPDQQYAVQIASIPGSVNLRGLSVSNLGGWGGIYYAGGGQLRVLESAVNNSLYSGIFIRSAGQLAVYDCTIVGAGSFGVGGYGTDATHRTLISIDNLRVSQTLVGVAAENWADVSVRNSVSFNNTAGAEASSTTAGKVARLIVERCVLDSNDYGVLANSWAGDTNWAVTRVSKSVITHSGLGAILGSGRILSRANNTVIDNPANEAFSDTFPAK